MNLRPAARGSQEVGFTPPRDHSFAQPCIYYSITIPSSLFVFGNDSSQVVGEGEGEGEPCDEGIRDCNENIRPCACACVISKEEERDMGE